MIISDLKAWREYLSFVYQIEYLHELKFLLIGGKEQDRKDKGDFVKVSLENFLENAKSKGEIDLYEVEMIDLTDRGLDGRTFNEIWQRSGNHDGVIYIPMFHNTERCPHLPLNAFDDGKPGVFSISKEGYDWTRSMNASKIGCYDCFFLD